MRLLVLVAGFSLVCGSLPAQQPSTPNSGEARQGFWFSLGAGVGSRGVSCDFCTEVEHEQGFSTTFRAGGTLSPQVTLGLDLITWVKPLNDPGRGEITLFNALIGELQFYPFRQKGLFLLGGGGYIVDVVDDDLVLDTPGMVVGIGYDILTGASFSWTPHFRYLRTMDGGNYTSSLFQFGISATWH